MPMRCTNRGQVHHAVTVEAYNKALAIAVRRLSIAGERVINHARSLPSPSAEITQPHQPHYIDRTANLRSSIGYIIVQDGTIVRLSDFAAVGGGTAGSSEGRKFAQRLAAENPSGLVLIVVAGMHYAKYVSSHGYDVLDTAEVISHKLIKQLFG